MKSPDFKKVVSQNDYDGVRAVEFGFQIHKPGLKRVDSQGGDSVNTGYKQRYSSKYSM